MKSRKIWLTAVLAVAVLGGMITTGHATKYEIYEADIENRLGGAHDVTFAQDGSIFVVTLKDGPTTIQVSKAADKIFAVKKIWETQFGNEPLVFNLTTTQRDSFTAMDGMRIFNTTLNEFQIRENGSWDSLVIMTDPRIPIQAENDALVGTNGVPSSTNKYVTNSDSRNSDSRAPTTHASTHTNATDDIQSATAAQKGLATAAQITKLDAIESGATADQTNGEIKTAYEANANTNEYDDAEQTKLAGIETAATADQTNAEIKTAYELNANTNEFDDAEQSKLAGVETAATADQTNAEIKTAYEANADTNEFDDTEQSKLAGVETAATADQTNAEIKTAYEANADTNEFDDTEQAKLAGIETAATASGSWTKIETKTASSSATIDFTTLSGTYRDFKVIGSAVVPVTDPADLLCRISVAASFQSEATDYRWQTAELDSAAWVLTEDTSDPSIKIMADVGGKPVESMSFELALPHPAGTVLYKSIGIKARGIDGSGNITLTESTGFYDFAASAVDGIQFLFSSGNIESGTFTLYGRAN